MDFWGQALLTIQEHISSQCFDTWFRPVICLGIKNGALHLVVPTESFRKCLLENYSQLLLDVIGSIAHISQNNLELNITVKSHDFSNSPDTYVQDIVSNPSIDSTTQSEQTHLTGIESGDSSIFLLNPKYTFDNFVVGSSNEFAHAAALAVAEKPSKAYNPLYLYGCAGLGKTHLMHAIGNLIKTQNSRARLCYLSSEQFMNDFIIALRHKERGQMLKFRQKYRNIDVLLMDDIQFLAGKEATQIEFFHTFNALYDAQKQIVIASDCAPKQISTLEERLHSRFEWGLIADIQSPDFETKLAIIKKKSQTDLANLSDDVAQFIAGGIRSNIRELEGALNRLSARASLNGMRSEDINLAYAKEVLKGLIKDEADGISSDSIVNAVATFFALKPAQLRAKTNAKTIAVPRQIAMYMCKKLTSQSLPQIGKDFGGKHHTTVLHSIRKIEKLREKDPGISDAVKKIENSLR
jgi:chromosomal replication initiator protein